jgi:hypothetical protein
MNPPETARPRPGLIRRAKTILKRFTFLRLLYRFYFRLGVQQIVVRRPAFAIFRMLGLRVLKREDLRREGARLRLTEYGDAEKITAGAALTEGPISERAATALGAYSFEVARPFIVEFDDVQLIGESALGFTADGALIAETGPPYFTEKDIIDNVPATVLARSRTRADGVEKIERAFSLVNTWNNNYCMWLSECLARLEGMEDYERRTGSALPIIIPGPPTRYQAESLALMGYPRERLLEWNGSRLRIGTLVVSSFRREYRGAYHYRVALSGLRWVRGKMLAGLERAAPPSMPICPRVFISRRTALARRIANEDEVLEALAPLGFRAYTLEEMSFPDQVRLFANAEIVAGPHGAGMMNLAFSDNVKVVELFGAFLQPSFSELARGLGFRYGFLECPPPRGDIRGWDADMLVDVAALRQLVAKVMA